MIIGAPGPGRRLDGTSHPEGTILEAIEHARRDETLTIRTRAPHDHAKGLLRRHGNAKSRQLGVAACARLCAQIDTRSRARGLIGASTPPKLSRATR
jgi:hypothetical protein